MAAPSTVAPAPAAAPGRPTAAQGQQARPLPGGLGRRETEQEGPGEEARRPGADLRTAGQRLRLATINIRGWNSYTSACDVQDLVDTRGDPEVLVLTETKRGRKTTLPAAMHKRYCIFESRRQEAAAGVAVLVKRQWCALDAAHHMPVPKDCQGYVAHVRLQPAGSSAVHLLGVYMPGDAERSQHRAAAYAHLESVLAAAAPGDTVLMTGDWNACLREADRPGQPTTADREHRRWAGQFPRLYSAYGEGQRAPTFSVGGMGGSASMIDDTLLLPPATAAGDAHLVRCCSIEQHGWSTDHLLLRCDIDLAAAGVDIPEPSPPAKRPPIKKLALPVTDDERWRAQARLREERAGDIARAVGRVARLATELEEYETRLAALDARQVHKLEALEGRPAREVIEELAADVMSLMSHAHRVALEECRVQVINPGGTHYRPRAVGRRRGKLVRGISCSRAAAAALRACRSGGPALDGEQAELRTFKANLGSYLRGQWEQEPALEPSGDALATLEKFQRRLEARKREIDAVHRRVGLQEAAQRQRQLLDEKPKLAHRNIFGRDQNRQQLAAVVDPSTGRPTTRPAAVIEATRQHFAAKSAPPAGRKTGRYLPAEAPRDYPWAQAAALDRYALETGATRLDRRPWLFHQVKDEQLFFQCCQRLANGKTPGPDEIPNEVLKMLPPEVKRVIHKLFVLMWAAGYTPAEWKASTTCLLHKKGPATDPSNYRPIGLANTVYKLWTSVVQRVLYEYAETHMILSETQSGFKQRTGRHIPLQAFVMLLEDARLTRQNVYTAQVDLTAAFNMIDQDKLLQIMYDLGIPTDLIEIVKDLYTGASTQYQTPYGLMPPVPVDRGTMQGDTLSPLLFLLYIEPLMRWLNAGQRGYAFGSVPEGEERARTRLACLAYADDLQLFASDRSGMEAQLQKLSEYSDWAHMKVNASKSFVTGQLHRLADHLGGYRSVEPMLRAQLRGMQVQGQEVAYLPPSAPFRYLGVTLTMTLD